MRALAVVLGMLVGAAAVAAGCTRIDDEDELGVGCDDDDDCADGHICGSDRDGERICIPGGECSSDSFRTTCLGDGLLGCNGDGERVWIDCRVFDDDDGAGCGEAPCNGNCANVALDFCLAGGAGSPCVDASSLIFPGGFILCPSADLACTLGDDGSERCVDVGFECTSVGAQCSGGFAVNCFGDATTAFASPTVFDCGSFGGTCGVVDGNAGCTVQVDDLCDGAFLRCPAGSACVGFDAASFAFGRCN